MCFSYILTTPQRDTEEKALQDHAPSPPAAADTSLYSALSKSAHPRNTGNTRNSTKLSLPKTKPQSQRPAPRKRRNRDVDDDPFRFPSTDQEDNFDSAQRARPRKRRIIGQNESYFIRNNNISTEGRSHPISRSNENKDDEDQFKHSRHALNNPINAENKGVNNSGTAAETRRGTTKQNTEAAEKESVAGERNTNDVPNTTDNPGATENTDNSSKKNAPESDEESSDIEMPEAPSISRNLTRGSRSSSVRVSVPALGSTNARSDSTLTKDHLRTTKPSNEATRDPNFNVKSQEQRNNPTENRKTGNISEDDSDGSVSSQKSKGKKTKSPKNSASRSRSTSGPNPVNETLGDKTEQAPLADKKEQTDTSRNNGGKSPTPGRLGLGITQSPPKKRHTSAQPPTTGDSHRNDRNDKKAVSTTPVFPRSKSRSLSARRSPTSGLEESKLPVNRSLFGPHKSPASDSRSSSNPVDKPNLEHENIRQTRNSRNGSSKKSSSPEAMRSSVRRETKSASIPESSSGKILKQPASSFVSQMETPSKTENVPQARSRSPIRGTSNQPSTSESSTPRRFIRGHGSTQNNGSLPNERNEKPASYNNKATRISISSSSDSDNSSSGDDIPSKFKPSKDDPASETKTKSGVDSKVQPRHESPESVEENVQTSEADSSSEDEPQNESPEKDNLHKGESSDESSYSESESESSESNDDTRAVHGKANNLHQSNYRNRPTRNSTGAFSQSNANGSAKETASSPMGSKDPLQLQTLSQPAPTTNHNAKGKNNVEPRENLKSLLMKTKGGSSQNENQNESKGNKSRFGSGFSLFSKLL